LALRLSKVDELILQTGHHTYLTAEDQCFFLGEYTARAGYSFSETNSRILNFKTSPEHRGTNRWYYKESAIRAAANDFRQVLNSPENTAGLRAATLVPIPPSKAKDDPLYDDRVLQMLRELGSGLQLDIREPVVQMSSADSFHDLSSRPRPDELATRYSLDETVTYPNPRGIWIFDDVLTTGCHFKAMKLILERRFPGVPIAGLFIARRVPQSVDPNAIFGGLP
jgi:hypothetical protein